MTTARFNHQAGPIARAMALAYEQAAEGAEHGRFACTAPRCSGIVTFSGSRETPHRTAGSCNTSGCIRWAAQ